MSTRLARNILNTKGIAITINEKENTVYFEKAGDKLQFKYSPRIKPVLQGDVLSYVAVEENDDSRETAMMLGTAISYSNSNIQGLIKPFKIELELRGTGYKAALKTENGKTLLVLNLGKSHDDVYVVPANIKVSLPSATQIALESSNKAAVGQASADIQTFRKVDVYKGKGVRVKGKTYLQKETKKKK